VYPAKIYVAEIWPKMALLSQHIILLSLPNSANICRVGICMSLSSMHFLGHSFSKVTE
jgi:hypothetical protein